MFYFTPKLLYSFFIILVVLWVIQSYHWNSSFRQALEVLEELISFPPHFSTLWLRSMSSHQRLLIKLDRMLMRCLCEAVALSVCGMMTSRVMCRAAVAGQTAVGGACAWPTPPCWLSARWNGERCSRPRSPGCSRSTLELLSRYQRVSSRF